MKRILILVFMVYMVAYAAPIEPDGSGTEADPYLITSFENLEWMGGHPYRYDDDHYLQTADINASVTYNMNDGYGMFGFGSESYPFSGVYDGGGYSIDSVYMNQSNWLINGFFEYSVGSEIKNVNLTNTKMYTNAQGSGLIGYADSTYVENCSVTGYLNAGIESGNLCGYAENSQFINCTADGTIDGTYDTGMLIGVADNCTVSGCSSQGTFIGECDGGLIGEAKNNSVIEDSYSTCDTNTGGGLIGQLHNSTINRCYASGNINGDSELGGLIGRSEGSTITECFATGTITGTNWACGGLIGWLNAGTSVQDSWSSGNVTAGYKPGGFVGDCDGSSSITNCYSTGFVDATYETGGGLVGIHTSGTITDSFWDTETSGYSTSPGGGTGKTTAQMQDQTTYTNWNFSTVWNINPGLNSGYPFHRWYFDIPFTGTGTQVDPFLVSNAVELNEVRNWEAFSFLQTANIDLGVSPWNDGAGWDPICDDTDPFTGDYDGDGYTISNLTIDRPSEHFIALFGYSTGAEIKDLSVTGVSVTGNDKTAGLLAYSGTSTVTNCHATGTVSGDFACGGLVGRSQISQISGCTAQVNVTGTSDYTGGLVGRAHNNSVIDNSTSSGSINGINRTGGLVGWLDASHISNSLSSGSVSGGQEIGGLAGMTYDFSTITQSGSNCSVTGTGNFCGGLVGWNAHTDITECYAYGTVSNAMGGGGLIGYSEWSETTYCYASGSVTGTSMAGGLIGYSWGITLDRCYSKGQVNCSSSAGGLIGFEEEGSTFDRSYWDTETSGKTTSAAGTGKTTAEMIVDTTYDSWNFSTSAWAIDPLINTGYPYLDWQGLVFVLQAPQNVVSVINEGNLELSWNAVPGATSYKVYSSDDPYGTFVEEVIPTVGETWTITFTEAKKFYYVVAVEDN